MARSYDLKLVTCVIGGVAINNYGEDDAIAFEWVGDLATSKVSGDGIPTYSRANDRRLKVTITLMATSKAIPLLMGLIETQHGDNLGLPPPLLVGAPFQMVDPVLGDDVSGEAVLVGRPAPSKSKEVPEVEFRLEIPQPKYVMGALNLL